MALGIDLANMLARSSTEVERVDVCSSNYHLLTRYRSAVDLQPSPSGQIATMSAGSRIRREVIATSTTGREW
jgi:hypothetical protein